MKTLIEPFTTVGGWTMGGSISVYAQNLQPEFIADHLTSSLVFKVPQGSQGLTFKKTVSITVPAACDFVFSLWSRNMWGRYFELSTDFSYQVSFDNGAHAYYIPTFRPFGDVTINNSYGITTVTTIIFTVLHNQEDYLILSAMNAVVDEYPLDILNGLSTELALVAAAQYPTGFATGDTVTGTAGASSCVLTGNHDFIARYALVQFGGTVESHIVDEWDPVTGVMTFLTSWSGPLLVNNHAGDTVVVLFPVTITLGETDLIQPSIALQGMQPEHVLRRAEVSDTYDTFDVAGPFSNRQEEQNLRYPVLIDCEAQHYETLARLNRVVRSFMARGYVWINARKHDFLWDIPPVEIDPEIVNETLPKTQHTLEIEVRETPWARVVLPKYTAYNLVMHILSPAAGDTVPPGGP
jgi:hypothetical protein